MQWTQKEEKEREESGRRDYGVTQSRTRLTWLSSNSSSRCDFFQNGFNSVSLPICSSMLVPLINGVCVLPWLRWAQWLWWKKCHETSETRPYEMIQSLPTSLWTLCCGTLRSTENVWGCHIVSKHHEDATWGSPNASSQGSWQTLVSIGMCARSL